jgi:WD40 repeat protein
MKVQFPNFPHDRTDTRPLPWLAIWLTGVIVMSSIPLHADEVAPYWAGQRLLLDWEEDEVTTPVMTSVVMNPATGQVAAGGDDHLVRIWDLESGARQHLLEGHNDWVRTVAFSPDGSLLVSAGHDGKVMFWNPQTGELIRTIGPLDGAIAMVRFSPDGELLAVTGFELSLPVYRVSDGVLVHQFACPCADMRALDFSPDSRLLAAGGRNGIVRVWQLDDGAVVRQYRAHRQRVRCLLFSPEGRDIVSAGEDRTVRITPVVGENRGEALPPGPAKILSMAFFDDFLMVGGSDNLIRAWHWNERREVATLRGHHGSVASLEALGDSLISGSFDTTVRIWRFTSPVARQLASEP